MGCPVNFSNHIEGAENFCTEASLYKVQGGGHYWLGAYGNMYIEASGEAWLFF